MGKISRKELKDMSYDEIKDIEAGDVDYKTFDWSDHCYNPYEDTCDIRCQGSSDCPLARYLTNSMYSDATLDRPSNKKITNYFLDEKLSFLKRIAFMKTNEGREFAEDFVDNFKFLSVDEFINIYTDNKGE